MQFHTNCVTLRGGRAVTQTPRRSRVALSKARSAVVAYARLAWAGMFKTPYVLRSEASHRPDRSGGARDATGSGFM